MKLPIIALLLVSATTAGADFFTFPTETMSGYLTADATLVVVTEAREYRSKPEGHVAADWLSLIRKPGWVILETDDRDKLKSVRHIPDLEIYPQ